MYLSLMHSYSCSAYVILHPFALEKQTLTLTVEDQILCLSLQKPYGVL